MGVAYTILATGAYLHILMCQVGALHAQSASDRLDEGKFLLKTQQYEAAEAHFRALAGDTEAFEPIASFYLGICLYKKEAYDKAQTHFEALKDTYPDYDLQKAIAYWAGLCASKNNKPAEALDHLSTLSSGSYRAAAEAAKENLIENLSTSAHDLPNLATLYEQHPEKRIKNKLQEGILRHILPQQRAPVLNSLFSTSWARDALRSAIFSDKKRANPQHIVLLLPFFFCEWESSPPIHPDSFVWSLYRGIKSAQIVLKRAGIDLQLYPYDTERSTFQTQKWLKTLKNKRIDLIIGPLYWDAIAPVQAFATKHRIPVLNPLSTNPRFIKASANAWLFQASGSSQAKKAAEFVKNQLNRHKTAVIFCEQLPQSINICEEYAQNLRADGFEIVFERYLSKDDTHIIGDSLTKVDREILEDVPLHEKPQEEGYIFKKGKGIYGETESAWHKEYWHIQPDSIGHIFIAGSHPSFLSYAISAVEQRPDTIPILTEAHWLEHREVDYTQLEATQIHFFSSYYFDKSSRNMKVFIEDFIARWGKAPDKYASIGYELIWTIGQAMHRYGANFMQHLQQKSSHQAGALGLGLRYTEKNRDNQVVPILQIQQGKLHIVHNSEQKVSKSEQK